MRNFYVLLGTSVLSNRIFSHHEGTWRAPSVVISHTLLTWSWILMLLVSKYTLAQDKYCEGMWEKLYHKVSVSIFNFGRWNLLFPSQDLETVLSKLLRDTIQRLSCLLFLLQFKLTSLSPRTSYSLTQAWQVGFILSIYFDFP